MLLLTCISPALGYSHFVRWVLSASQLNWTTGILNAKEIIHRNELSQVLKERKTEQQPGRKAYNWTIKECKGWRQRIWTDQHSSLFFDCRPHWQPRLAWNPLSFCLSLVSAGIVAAPVCPAISAPNGLALQTRGPFVPSGFKEEI